jgi:hypothetical protein
MNAVQNVQKELNKDKGKKNQTETLEIRVS